MSYSTMHYVPEQGEIVGAVEFRNAWGWAASIWSRCCEHVLHTGSAGAWLFGEGVLTRIFSLIDEPGTPNELRLTIEASADKAVVLRSHFETVARALEAFNTAYPAAEGTVNHLPAVAAALREVPEELDDGRPIIGVCFTNTSVADDQWRREDPSIEDGYRWFDFSRDTDRFIVGENPPAPTGV